jgi:hypothetical protein
MSSIRNVCVYCGSSAGNDDRFAEAAEALGRILAAEGIGLVYGGGGNGMMGHLAKAMLAAGGYVTGIIPGFLVRKEHALTAAQEMLVVEDMHERKHAMFDRADAFIALPGGIGTLEEFLEVMVLRYLNRLHKPLILVNQDGFYDELLRFFERMTRERFKSPGLHDLFTAVATVDEVWRHLRNPKPFTADELWRERPASR